MKKNSIGQNWYNAHPEVHGKGHFEIKDGISSWKFNEPETDENGAILFAIIFDTDIRKKDRRSIRLNRNLQRFCTKCKKCVSKNKNFCNDLELDIDKVWSSEKYNSYKFSKHNGRCSFFVNKDTRSSVK